MLFGSKRKKTPCSQRNWLRANKDCPRFHLNSHPADGHFIPGNGGVRRQISVPRLKGAFSSAPARTRTDRPLSGAGPRGYSSLSQPFDIVGNCIMFSRFCQEKGPGTRGQSPVFPAFLWIRFRFADQPALPYTASDIMACRYWISAASCPVVGSLPDSVPSTAR